VERSARGDLCCDVSCIVSTAGEAGDWVAEDEGEACCNWQPYESGLSSAEHWARNSGAQKARTAATAKQKCDRRRRLEQADEWFLIDVPLFTYQTCGKNEKMQVPIDLVPKLNSFLRVFP